MNRAAATGQLGNLLLLAIGLFFLIGAASDLDMGTPRRMGPGFFPVIVGAILCVLAIAGILVDIARMPAPERPDPIAFAAVVAGMALFALLTPWLGVLPATALSVVATSFAEPRLKAWVRATLAIFVAVGVWLVFVVGLQLPFVAIAGF